MSTDTDTAFSRAQQDSRDFSEQYQRSAAEQDLEHETIRPQRRSLAEWQVSRNVTSRWLLARPKGYRRRKPKRREPLPLPPPIVGREDLDGSGLRLQIAPEWRRIAARYFLRVPLPLPGDAIVQNALLFLLTFVVDPPSRDAEPEKRHIITREQGSLLRLLGIRTSRGSETAVHRLMWALVEVAELLPGRLKFRPEREVEHGRMIWRLGYDPTRRSDAGTNARARQRPRQKPQRQAEPVKPTKPKQGKPKPTGNPMADYLAMVDGWAAAKNK